MNTRPAPPASAPRPWLQRYGGLLLVLAVIVVMAGVRFRLRDCPLERDEGEYAYAGQLLLQGIPPYQLACNMKFPGTYAAYAAIMAVFGQTPAGIHLGLLGVTSLTALMVYWLGRRLVNEVAGIVAAMSCVFLSASPALLGLAGHATHFAAFFATAGTCLLLAQRPRSDLIRILSAGLMFGLALLMKQQAAPLALWGLVLVVSQHRKKWQLPVLFSLAVLAPFGITCLILWYAGVFAQFWFWTITYARQYLAVLPANEFPQLFRNGIAYATGRCLPLWIAAGLGLVALFLVPRFRNRRFVLTGFFLASFLTTVPGFYFRPHYFLLMVPALSLLAGCTASALPRWPRAAPALGCALVFGLAWQENRDIWCQLTPAAAVRRTYIYDSFPEVEAVAAFIRTHSTPADTLAVLGSEPEIYFRAQRHSATIYLYTYPLMEPQAFARQMQLEMISQIEAARPKFVVLALANSSWLQRPGSDTTLTTWWPNYSAEHYTQVGVAEASATNTVYRWGSDAAHYEPVSDMSLLLYQRNDTLRP